MAIFKKEKGFTRTPKFGVTPKGGGFTLIELLVVVALIGILASVIMASTRNSRLRGTDAAVTSNLVSVRAQSEIFYLYNSSSYLPAGGFTFGIAPCPAYNASGTNMLSQNAAMADAIARAISAGSGSSCYNSSNIWAVAVGLRLNANTSWCVDNMGASRQVASGPSSAINPSTFLCN